MSIEEKILRYLHDVFPDIQVFNRDIDLLKKLELDPAKDLLEFEKEFDRLKDKYYIKLDKLMIFITFQGISYYENKYLYPNYYYLKAIKILLEFIERLEKGDYTDDLIPNSEIIDGLKKEGIIWNFISFF